MAYIIAGILDFCFNMVIFSSKTLQQEEQRAPGVRQGKEALLLCMLL